MVKTSRACKGKDRFDAGNAEGRLLGLSHEGVFLFKAEVAARLHIDDRLFGLGRGKELGAFVVLGVIHEDYCHQRTDRADRDKRHDGIASDGMDYPAEG